MLSGLTQWGCFRYWWVLAKAAITLSQLYVGIAILGPNMSAAARSAESGGALPPLVWLGSALMISALAFQTWLAVAKPWKRTPWTPSARIRTGVAPMFLVSLVVPFVDYAMATFVTGRPAPALMLLTAIVYPVWRARRSGVETASRPAGPAQHA